MGWTGKIIGASLGAALGPVGAAVGAFLGHQYDSHVESRQAAGAAGPQESFFRATFLVMGHVAKADGRVSEREIAAARSVMSALRLTPPQVLQAIALFNSGKRTDFDLNGELQRLCTACSPQSGLRSVFIEIQLRAALAGNDMSGLARERVTRVALALGFDAASLGRLEAALRGGGSGGGANAGISAEARMAAAYRVLEVEPDASDADVTKAYRRQMSRNHPDKLKANGLPDSMLEHAKERTQQIREAWELLREKRGLG
jgi:DnaJ like chaperone protein